MEQPPSTPQSQIPTPASPLKKFWKELITIIISVVLFLGGLAGIVALIINNINNASSLSQLPPTPPSVYNFTYIFFAGLLVFSILMLFYSQRSYAQAEKEKDMDKMKIALWRKWYAIPILLYSLIVLVLGTWLFPIRIGFLSGAYLSSLFLSLLVLATITALAIKESLRRIF